MEVGDNLLSRADNYETSSFFSLVLQEMSTNTGQSVYVLSKQHNVMLIFSSNFVSSSSMVKEVAEQVHGLLKMNYIPVFVHTESAEKATEFLCSFRDPVISEFLHVADPHFLYFQQFGFFANTRNSSGSNRGSSRFSVPEITLRNSNDKRKSVRVPSFVEVLSLKGSSIPGVFLIEEGSIKAEYRHKLPYDGSKIDFLRMVIFPSTPPAESLSEQATESCKLTPDIRKSISLFQPISIIDDSPSLPVKHKSPTKAKRLSVALARKSVSLSSGIGSAGSFCESVPLAHQMSFRDSSEPPSTPLPPSTPQLLNKHSPEEKSSHSLTLEKIAKLSQYVTQNEAKVKKIKSNEAKTKTCFRPFSLRFSLCCGFSENDDSQCRNSVNTGVNNVMQPINSSSKLGQRASSKMNVRDVLSSNAYRPYFKLFATKEHSVENVLFWVHVEQFKKIKKPKERATRAKEIADLFFNESSMMQINTSEKLIELFYHDLGANGPHREIFDSILKDLEVGVLSDIFYRFKKSKLYKEMSEKSRTNKKP